MFKRLPEFSRSLLCISMVALCLGVFLGQTSEATATPLQNPEPIPLVHRDVIAVGPYQLAIGFSEWPIRAERSLDILFLPEDGITAKKGTLTLINPSGQEETNNLVRHPRQRTVWGRDIIALPDQGQWTMRFALSGPQGEGSGQFAFTVLERPGPPIFVSWLPTLFVALLLLALPFVAWHRVKPLRAPTLWVWREGNKDGEVEQGGKGHG